MSSARTTIVTDIAPVAPPCFPTRSIWVEYLKSAVEYGRSDHPTPLIVKRGEEPRFNYDYNFCADCSSAHAASMVLEDRCKPLHLRILGLKVIPIVVVAVTPAKLVEVA